MFLRIPARRALPRLTAPFLQTTTTPLRAYSSSSPAAANTAATAAPTTPQLPKPTDLDEHESALWDLLTAELSPTELLVKDVSGGCGSMYSIDITSASFRGLGILKQQRLVNSVLGERVKGWHGVQLRTKAA
ncbi:related to Altered inheritance of mitochondria protein 1 [Cephalotrichum gorgonifer]|uniref:Related to Altered inheritance of mitochondria protein 1 n=1 Tax=Cephalotrichum gorgonifer TaxID=2041049 RepID=A0AAE8MVR6_9PEZI|nr:related to Altered inheritance of mitochondria protein 1 [Cephalotrichum gorgonifer]